MKIEDMKFPIEVELEDGCEIYQIRFTGSPWFFRCCESKMISGEVKSKTIPKVIKGFKFNENIESWGASHFFRFCPVCGKGGWSEYDNMDIVRKAWLKLVNER